MNKREMTPWFPIDIEPVHIGVYEVQPEPEPDYLYTHLSKWDGRKWCSTATNVPEADMQTSESWAMYHNIKPQWRGFTNEQT